MLQISEEACVTAATNLYSFVIQQQPKQNVGKIFDDCEGLESVYLCSANCKRHQFHRIFERSMAEVII